MEYLGIGIFKSGTECMVTVMGLLIICNVTIHNKDVNLKYSNITVHWVKPRL